MPFETISTDEIAVGLPVLTTTQEKIKANFDDQESRLELVESREMGPSMILLSVRGQYWVSNNVLKTQITTNLKIKNVFIVTNVAGTAGDLEIDIRVIRAGVDLGTVFTSKPSLDYLSGDDAISRNTVVDQSKVNLLVDDELVLDITSGQVGGSGFLVRVDYENA